MGTTVTTVDEHVQALARDLLDRAVRDQQASCRITDAVPVDAVRAVVRDLARTRHVHVRTGVVEGALVVVLADADLWHEPTGAMRRKLAPED